MKRIPQLDGWRAVAIVMVLVHHTFQGFYVDEASYTQSFTRYGAFGVDIFFGLSGLLITSRLLEDYNASGGFRLSDFYIRRAFRILPPCVVFLLAYTALDLWKSKLELAGSFLFFRNYVPQYMTGFGSGHLWSLAVEEHFYLIWPALLLIFGPRRSINVVFVLASATGLWRILQSQFLPDLWSSIPEHFRTDVRLDALLWGCVPALLLYREGGLQKLAEWLKFPIWFAAVWMLILSFWRYSLAASVSVAVLIPIVLAGTLLHPEWRISRALSWAPVCWLGRISYSLYLWQQIFLMPGWEHDLKWWQHWPWNLIGALTVASASYYLVERPLIAVGRRLASGRRLVALRASPISIQ